jgi:hypothetical protein
MEDSQEIQKAWLDEDGTISLTIDRVTIAFHIEEFLSFCELIEEMKEALVSSPELVVGTYQDNGETKEVLLMKPEEEDYN